MSQFTLYCFAQSGNAYKAALMLNLCGADWRAEFVDFFHGATEAPAFKAMNEMGEVPVLRHGDIVLSQSGGILDYLASHFERYGWNDESERREILRWLLFDNHKLTGYIATLRYLMQFAASPEPAVVAFLEKRSRGALQVLDGHLADRDYVVGGRLTIADLSLCGYLFWPDEFGVDWSEYPAIARWLERIRACPEWEHPYRLMPGHPLVQ
ncbi:MAG: glutathione S-transferase [Gammaproteobacteria bacterium]